MAFAIHNGSPNNRSNPTKSNNDNSQISENESLLNQFASSKGVSIEAAIWMLARLEGDMFLRDLERFRRTNKNLKLSRIFFLVCNHHKKSLSDMIDRYNGIANAGASIGALLESRKNEMQSNSKESIEVSQVVDESPTSFKIFGSSEKDSILPTSMMDTLKEVQVMLKELRIETTSMDTNKLISVEVTLDSTYQSEIADDLKDIFIKSSNLEKYIIAQLDKADRILTKSIDFSSYAESERDLINNLKLVYDNLLKAIVSANIDTAETARASQRAYIRGVGTIKDTLSDIAKALGDINLRDSHIDKDSSNTRFASNPFMGRVKN